MTDTAIVADNLVKRFGDVEALCGVSFAAPRGTVLGLLGPNGAGKTTAVRILTTLLRADSGRAEVLGMDVARDPVRTRMSIGLAGQNVAVDEKLAPIVLAGKRVFHDTTDPRMARDNYLSCAVCHFDGDQDGRVWDFTDRGEGLRNTTSLTS